MKYSEIVLMAQGYPPSHIGKDHEEVVTEVSKHSMSMRQLLDETVTENARLRHLLDMVGKTGNANFGLTSLPTPATDAYLNAVRAEGVEMFGGWLRDQAITFDAHGRHHWADRNRVVADSAKRMAAQLRAGAPKGDSE